MKALNILSIDWDYFIDANMTIRTSLFPDCPNENYPEYLRQLIWLSRYQDDRILDIKVNNHAIVELKKLFATSHFYPLKMMIVDSHQYCYEFVKTLYTSWKCSAINLINIDFHHDMYENDNDDVDCGNWLEKLIDLYPYGNYIWIHHLDSDKHIENLKYGNNLNLDSNIECIHTYPWDAIFICKSSMWSPPHLDNEFAYIFRILDNRSNIILEPDIFRNRYNDDFIQSVRMEKEMLSRFSNQSCGISSIKRYDKIVR